MTEHEMYALAAIWHGDRLQEQAKTQESARKLDNFNTCDTMRVGIIPDTVLSMLTGKTRMRILIPGW